MWSSQQGSRRGAVWLACAVVIAVGAWSVSEGAQFPQGPRATPDAPQRIAAVVKDAQELAKRRFPTANHLGPNWLPIWQMQHRRLRYQDAAYWEKRYWQRFQAELNSVWAQFHGLSAAEIEQALRKCIDQGHAQVGAGASTVPAEGRFLLTKPGMVQMQMQMLRMMTARIYQSDAMVAAHNSLQMLDGLRRRAETQDETERQKIELTTLRKSIALLCPDIEDKDYEESLKLFAEEVHSVRRTSRMVYVYASEQTGEELDPLNAEFAVDLWIVAREAIGTRLKDPTTADFQTVEKGLAEMYTEILTLLRDRRGKALNDETDRLDGEIRKYTNSPRIVQDLQKQREAVVRQRDRLMGAGPVRVTCQTRDMGDHSWILFAEGFPEGDPNVPRDYFGRLRNGNAVVSVRGRGSYPKDWFLKQLDYVLAAMDETTQVFCEN